MAHRTFFSGILDIFYFNVMKVYLFVNKTETFEINIIIFIIFYIFLNKTIDIFEFESWINLMTQTQIMTQQKYTLELNRLSEMLVAKKDDRPKEC